MLGPAVGSHGVTVVRVGSAFPTASQIPRVVGELGFGSFQRSSVHFGTAPFQIFVFEIYDAPEKHRTPLPCSRGHDRNEIHDDGPVREIYDCPARSYNGMCMRLQGIKCPACLPRNSLWLDPPYFIRSNDVSPPVRLLFLVSSPLCLTV